MTGKVNVCNN